MQRLLNNGSDFDENIYFSSYSKQIKRKTAYTVSQISIRNAKKLYFQRKINFKDNKTAWKYLEENFIVIFNKNTIKSNPCNKRE